ncbi:PREDICTED: uncharacterized protein LOC106815836 [Priapulus caudatus]|uniref:Uncharacterized protein LOC106815836 n=1 Tax=Priapulus caudatus TaxID=37621 RepID=A0ABM1EUG9_PRICU|nr:PREDICTED: uncharacterized protein LOC106815836 [Priapulus caudatus]
MAAVSGAATRDGKSHRIIALQVSGLQTLTTTTTTAVAASRSKIVAVKVDSNSRGDGGGSQVALQVSGLQTLTTTTTAAAATAGSRSKIVAVKVDSKSRGGGGGGSQVALQVSGLQTLTTTAAAAPRSKIVAVKVEPNSRDGGGSQVALVRVIRQERVASLPPDVVPYQCNVCGIAYLQCDQLAAHVKEHVMALRTPYVCAVCALPFRLPAECARHYRTCHIANAASVAAARAHTVLKVEPASKAAETDARTVLKVAPPLRGKAEKNASAAHTVLKVAPALREKAEKNVNTVLKVATAAALRGIAGAGKDSAVLTQLKVAPPVQGNGVTEPADPPSKKRDSPPPTGGAGEATKPPNGPELDAAAETEEGGRDRCCHCGKAFADAVRRMRHERLVHNAQKLSSCRYCGRMFNHSGHRNEHERLHTGQLPFTCHDCCKGFVNRSKLRQHQAKGCLEQSAADAGSDGHQRVLTGDERRRASGHVRVKHEPASDGEDAPAGGAGGCVKTVRVKLEPDEEEGGGRGFMHGASSVPLLVSGGSVKRAAAGGYRPGPRSARIRAAARRAARAAAKLNACVTQTTACQEGGVRKGEIPRASQETSVGKGEVPAASQETSVGKGEVPTAACNNESSGEKKEVSGACEESSVEKGEIPAVCHWENSEKKEGEVSLVCQETSEEEGEMPEICKESSEVKRETPAAAQKEDSEEEGEMPPALEPEAPREKREVIDAGDSHSEKADVGAACRDTSEVKPGITPVRRKSKMKLTPSRSNVCSENKRDSTTACQTPSKTKRKKEVIGDYPVPSQKEGEKIVASQALSQNDEGKILTSHVPSQNEKEVKESLEVGTPFPPVTNEENGLAITASSLPLNQTSETKEGKLPACSLPPSQGMKRRSSTSPASLKREGVKMKRGSDTICDKFGASAGLAGGGESRTAAPRHASPPSTSNETCSRPSADGRAADRSTNANPAKRSPVGGQTKRQRVVAAATAKRGKVAKRRAAAAKKGAGKRRRRAAPVAPPRGSDEGASGSEGSSSLRGRSSCACRYCGRAFKHSGHRNEHERLHTGQLPYKCDLCDKAFVNPSKLKYHHANAHRAAAKEGAAAAKEGTTAAKKGSAARKGARSSKKAARKRVRGKRGTVAAAASHVENSVEVAPPVDANSLEVAPPVDANSLQLAPPVVANSLEVAPPVVANSLEVAPPVVANSLEVAPLDNTNSLEVALPMDANSLQVAPPVDSKDGRRVVDVNENNEPAAVKKKRRPLAADRARKHVCATCGKGFKRAGHLDDHALTHSDDRQRPHRCVLCSAAFLRPAHLVSHMNTHAGEHACAVCRLPFSSVKTLKMHVSKSHPSEEEVEGGGEKEDGGEGETQSAAARDDDHGTTTGGAVGACDVIFENGDSLSANGHDGHAAFGREMCGALYGSGEELALHARSPAPPGGDGRKHRCEVCGKSFVRAGHLRDHVALCHTGETPYRCAICGAGFARKHRLRAHHDQTHDDGGEDCGVACGVCGVPFVSKDELGEHLKKKLCGEGAYGTYLTAPVRLSCHLV